jgi:hypothetical protein
LTNAKANRRVLVDLFPIGTPHDLLTEVVASVDLSAPDENREAVANAVGTAVRLYRGEWEPYSPCDTRYHDIWHAAETFLAMGCLVNGAVREGVTLTLRQRALGLIAAILHDAGYIRSEEEKGFPGARLRAVHERRGGDFLTRHANQLGLADEEVSDCRAMIQSTFMGGDFNAIAFRSASAAQLGRMLATADLIAQLSSATYLEKLIDLFEEDQADNHPRYTDMTDCFRKALAFDAVAHDRLQNILPAANAYLTSHFQARWGDSRNLYAVAIERQKKRLAVLLRHNDFEPHRHLRRWGSLGAVRRVFQ